MTFRQEVKAYLRQRKQETGCSQCSESHPGCLDFHHTDSFGKEFTVADFLKGHQPRFADLLKEVSKCQILCANCHRKKHYRP